MSHNSDVPRLNRGELMRQIAALHARMATSFQRENERPRLTVAERQEVLQQIAALESRLMESSFNSAAAIPACEVQLHVVPDCSVCGKPAIGIHVFPSTLSIGEGRRAASPPGTILYCADHEPEVAKFLNSQEPGSPT